MLELDTIRGPHSTGVLFVDTKGATEVVKKVGTPWDLYGYKAADQAFNVQCNILLGHNRWATQGKVNNQNAHPFDVGNIVGVHNGTLTTRGNLLNHTIYDVDSENLYADMNRYGVYETVPKLNGAFALVWFDKETEQLSMIRNKERPLFYTYTKDKKTLLWASEAWMIRVAASTYRVDIEDVEILPEMVLHTFDIDFSYPYSAKVFEKATLRKLNEYVAPNYGHVTRFPRPALVGKDETVKKSSSDGQKEVEPSTEKKGSRDGSASFVEYQKYVNQDILFEVHTPCRQAGAQPYIQCALVEDERISIRCFPHEGDYMWKKLIAGTSYFKGRAKAFSSYQGHYLTVDLRSIVEVDFNELDNDIPPLVIGFEGQKLTLAEFDKAVSCGCAWCSVVVDEEESETIEWISSCEYICTDCVDLPDVKEYLKLQVRS